MAQNDTFKRYLDAGMAFTQLSRERAEEFVKDLVKAGEVRRKEAEEVIEALLERSRKNTEDLVNIVRNEVADQLRNLGLEDVAKRAGLPERVVDAAETADDTAERVADAVDADPAAAVKKAAKKAAAAKKAPPTTDTPLVVPGAPKKAPAKKLIVPASASTTPAGGAAKKKAAPAKKAAGAKKSGPSTS